jgi:hypothetical protein
MTIIGLIEDIRNSNRLDDIYDKYSLDRNAEAIEIFMEQSLGIDAPIHFFSIEETGCQLVIEKNGIEFISLFTTWELFERVKANIALTNHEIALGLLNYRINDA